MPQPYITSIALYLVFDATDNNNNALALFMLLIATSLLVTLFIGQVNLFVYRDWYYSSAEFEGRTNLDWGI